MSDKQRGKGAAERPTCRRCGKAYKKRPELILQNLCLDCKIITLLVIGR